MEKKKQTKKQEEDLEKVHQDIYDNCLDMGKLKAISPWLDFDRRLSNKHFNLMKRLLFTAMGGFLISLTFQVAKYDFIGDSIMYFSWGLLSACWIASFPMSNFLIKDKTLRMVLNTKAKDLKK